MLPVVLALFLHADPEPPAAAAPVPAAAAPVPAAPVPAPAPKAADVRYDHRGAIGLLLGLSGQRKDANAAIENTWRGALHVGASFNVGWASNELIVMASVSMTRTDQLRAGGDPSNPSDHVYGLGLDGTLWGGFRGYFGERWKTFFDLDLALNVVPGFTVGPRVGIGLQYELSSLVGLFANLSANIGFGTHLMWRADLMLGVQLRSFLLED